MVVVYPEAIPERAAAQAQLHAEMVEGVKAMGAQLRDRVNSGGSDDADLPSLSEIDSLMEKAIAEVNSIHVQHGQVFCTARQLKDYAVARCGLHQRTPRGDTQLMWLRLRSISSVPTMLTTRSAPAALA
jgi:hypothetical protein